MVPEPLTITAAYRVAPGRESEFRSWSNAVLGMAGQFPGFLGGGVLALRAGGDTASDWHVVQRFDSEYSAGAWENSTTRMQWESYMRPFAQEIERRTVRGLNSWFDESAVTRSAQPFETPFEPKPAASSPPSPPPKWKLWFVNMSAVFPPVLIFNLTALPYLDGLNFLIRTLLLCLSVTALVTWVLMPRLQRFFKKWLYPPLQAFSGRHKRRST